MTSKPISQRLKEVGFEVISPDNGFYAQAGEDLEVGIMSRDVKKDEWYDCTYLGDFYFEDEWYNQLNSYDAETLFTWLVENHFGEWSYYDRTLTIESETLNCARDIEYEGSLADLLGETIIFMLSQVDGKGQLRRA